MLTNDSIAHHHMSIWNISQTNSLTVYPGTFWNLTEEIYMSWASGDTIVIYLVFQHCHTILLSSLKSMGYSSLPVTVGVCGVVEPDYLKQTMNKLTKKIINVRFSSICRVWDIKLATADFFASIVLKILEEIVHFNCKILLTYSQYGFRVDCFNSDAVYDVI